MAVHANFDGQDYKDISGYKISTCVQVNMRIAGAFYIYVEQVVSTETAFSPLDMSSPLTGAKSGTLIITDDDRYRNYQFNNIDLIDYQIHFSHFRKVRLLTFKYDPAVTNAGNFCSLGNEEESRDRNNYRNRFAHDYTFNLENFEESLLSISSKFTRNGNEYIRFGTQRTKDNSFMSMALTLDQEIPNGSIKPKTITYKGQATTIDKRNLVALLVDETYGSFLPYSLPSLDAISGLAKDVNYNTLLIVDYDPLTPFQYLQHAVNPPRGTSLAGIDQYGSSIETAVVIFNNGNYLDHSKSMV